jgi:hypothetical protein
MDGDAARPLEVVDGGVDPDPVGQAEVLEGAGGSAQVFGVVRSEEDDADGEGGVEGRHA